MATFTVTIPNAILDDLIDAMALGTGWTETIIDDEGEEIPNPETKAQWAKRILREWIKRHYRKYKGDEAVKDIAPETARQAAIDQAVQDTADLTVT